MEADVLAESYRFTDQVKIAYSFPRGIALPSGQLIMKPFESIADLKKYLHDKHELQLMIYLKRSFMPPQDSRIGDLTLCYGKTQVDRENPNNKTYILPVDCFPGLQYG